MNRMYSAPGEDLFDGRINDNVELLKAWAGTTLAFAIAFAGGQVFRAQFLEFLLIAAITGGIGFVVHELAHRVVARQYGAQAFFKSNDGMLLISILVAFSGWFIAAPGAVWHRGGALNAQRSGLIALAGPASNFVLAALFASGFLLLTLPPVLRLFAEALPIASFLATLCLVGYNINAWLGLFNLIPVPPFDGDKIWRWSKPVLIGTAAVGVVMVFVLPRFIF